MSAKSSPTVAPKTTTTRKRKPASTPANIGITQAMRARPVYRREPLIGNEDTVTLHPVPVHVFFNEVVAMRRARYTSETEGHGSCDVCGGSSAVGITYWQRHRNGKKNHDSQRGFLFCFDCQSVTESMLVDSEEPFDQD